MSDFMFGACAGALAAFLYVAVIDARPRDDTDPPGGRSDMRLTTDFETGCHYLQAPGGGITPRLNGAGQHMGVQGMSASLKLGGPAEVMVFFRAEAWYMVQGVQGVDLRKQAEDNALLNPGTLRVEDLQGTVLWRPQ